MHKFCPYCGQQITAGAIKCRYCGRMLKSISSQRGEIGEEQKNRKTKTYGARALELIKNNMNTKFFIKYPKIIISILGAICLLVGLAFYINGPTEYKVAKLSSEHNSKALMQMVNARTNSILFANVTKAASKALIASGNKTYINSLANYLLADAVNLQQKEAIISAFTDSKVLVPNFFKIYDNNKSLRIFLQNNGLAVDADIFQEKIVMEGNALLKLCRNEPGNYDAQINALQIYNVAGLAADNMLQNLKGIADIYAIEGALHFDDDATLQYLKFLQNQPDVPILAQNTHFFRAVAVRVRQRKIASDRINELMQELNNMHVQENVQNEQAKIAMAQETINKTRYIEYLGLKYFNNGALYVSLRDGGLAEIVNSPSGVENSTWHRAHVIKIGSVGITNYYRQWIVPVYKIVDISLAEVVINKHVEEIEKLNSAKKNIEDNIALSLQAKKQADSDAEKLFSNMGDTLNKITAGDIFKFSKDGGQVPLFVQ